MNVYISRAPDAATAATASGNFTQLRQHFRAEKFVDGQIGMPTAARFPLLFKITENYGHRFGATSDA